MTDIADDQPWPVADLRDPEQISRDRAAVRSQVDRLTEAADMFDQLTERSARNGRGLTVLPQPTGRVLVAAGEVVVGAGGTARLAGYAAAGTARGAQILRADAERGCDDLLADVRALRKQKISANLNPIVPLGYVIKSDSFPAPTRVSRRFTPAEIDPTVRVAIIDTGRDATERTDGWFAGIDAIGVDPLDVVPPRKRNDFFSGHGTFTAGVVRQVSARCEIAVYRFTGDDGLGTDVAAADMMHQAVADAGDRRLIINASFGAPAIDGEPPLAMSAAVQRISRLPHVLIVASAGNDGTGEKLYPAAFPQVTAVGALNADLTGAPFSNRGSWVDCSAVGVGVVSTFVPGLLPPEPDPDVPDVVFGADAWAAWSGTSFSAPQISGAVAHLCTTSAGLTPRAAYQQLVQGAADLPDFGKVVHVLPGTPV